MNNFSQESERPCVCVLEVSTCPLQWLLYLILAEAKVQLDKQRSTKHIHKTKDRVKRTPLKTGDELRCSRRVSSSCSTSDTRRVILVTNPVISHDRGKDREVFTIKGTYPLSFVRQIFHNGQPSHGGHREAVCVCVCVCVCVWTDLKC
jgi:hypothetical protein